MSTEILQRLDAFQHLIMMSTSDEAFCNPENLLALAHVLRDMAAQLEVEAAAYDSDRIVN
jgi:hypothetical protein